MNTSKIKPEIIFVMILGMLAIFAPVIIKTKSISALVAPHALLIVLGGTLCAGCIAFSTKEIIKAFCSLKSLFIAKNNHELLYIADELVEMAKISRAKGVLALREYSEYIRNPFLYNALKTALEETDIKALEENLRMMSFYENKNDFKNMEIFEELGGYAPTFGMLGAIIGLIQISTVNTNPQALLSGIATAFIATIYGVGVANLVFLPIAKKLKNNLNEKLFEQEIIISGIIDIANMQSSIVIGEKLDRILRENEISRKGKVIPFAA